MMVVLLDSLEQTVLDELLGDNVLYRPDLLQKAPSILGRTLAALGADAVVTSAEVPPGALARWHAARPATLAIRVIVGPQPDAGNGVCEKKADRKRGEHIAECAYGATAGTAYLAAFEMLEHEFTLRSLAAVAQRVVPVRRAFGKRVVMVGAGLVNLITAHTLQQAGYQVLLVDKGPDPRDNAMWKAYGCSRGGDDARMFTLSEMNNYHDKKASASMNSQFRRTVVEQGWSAHRGGSLSDDEQRWIDEFECLPVWLAKRYNEDVFEFNRESGLLWERWIRDDTDLFTGSFLREGILRLFSDQKYFEQKVAIQRSIGAAQRALSPHEISDEYPALADAVAGGHIIGGIDGLGFTIRAHEFMRLLLDRLAQGGAAFRWNELADRIVMNANGSVIAIECSGQFVEADHYVISPGAYGNSLLRGTRSSGRIHGVLGAWLTLANVEPQLPKSIKISRTGHITDAANVTISTNTCGEPILIVGSGYGHTGVDPCNIDSALLEEMYGGVVDTAKKYFPRAYRVAADRGGLEQTFKYCVRPWTATGLGIFEVIEAASGGRCVITGGHNTGGFAQAPTVAVAVLAALRGLEHPMHQLYHPDRASAFLADPSRYEAGAYA